MIIKNELNENISIFSEYYEKNNYLKSINNFIKKKIILIDNSFYITNNENNNQNNVENTYNQNNNNHNTNNHSNIVIICQKIQKIFEKILEDRINNFLNYQNDKGFSKSFNKPLFSKERKNFLKPSIIKNIIKNNEVNNNDHNNKKKRLSIFQPKSESIINEINENKNEEILVSNSNIYVSDNEILNFKKLFISKEYFKEIKQKIYNYENEKNNWDLNSWYFSNSLTQNYKFKKKWEQIILNKLKKNPLEALFSVIKMEYVYLDIFQEWLTSPCELIHGYDWFSYFLQFLTPNIFTSFLVSNIQYSKSKLFHYKVEM